MMIIIICNERTGIILKKPPLSVRSYMFIIFEYQTIQTIFASFALFTVNKIMHRKGRKERKVLVYK